MNTDIDVKVERIYRLESDTSLKGFADVVIDESILIKGLRIVNGKKGLFIGMPQELGKDGKWYSKVVCLNDDIKQKLTDVVMSAYEE